MALRKDRRSITVVIVVESWGLVQARSREAKNLIAKDGLTEGTHINPNKE